MSWIPAFAGMTVGGARQFIEAAGMHAHALAFWRADNGVWLTDHVPPQFLKG